MAAPPEPCAVEGTAFHDLNGQPLPRTRVLLERMDSKGAAATTTDDGGRFRFDGIKPGFYSLTASRDGFLRTSLFLENGFVRQSLMLWRNGQRITGIVARLRPAGVVAGRVRYRDGESALGVAVQIWRQYHVRGRRAYANAGSAVTNDLGEYRVHSLLPGTYFVAAIRRPSEPVPGVAEQEAPAPRPVTTFYTAATRLGEGTPVRVGLGEEVKGIDIYLAESRVRAIRGRALSAVSGRALSAPTIALRWLDPTGAGAVPAPVRIRAAEGAFQIDGITPGTYLLTVGGVDDKRAVAARQLVTVADADIDNLEIGAGPSRLWSGAVRFGKPRADDQLPNRVTFEPRSDLVASVSAEVKKDGTFEIALMPEETYDVFVEGGAPDAYLQAALLHTSDLLRDGFTVSRADKPETIELVMTREAAQVSGTVSDATANRIAGASVVLLPQPLASRLQAVMASSTDEYGGYRFRGVPPGRYLLFAWVAEAPCDLFDPALPAECTRNARTVEVVNAGDVGGVTLRLDR